MTSEVPDEEASKRADGTSAAEGPPSNAMQDSEESFKSREDDRRDYGSLWL